MNAHVIGEQLMPWRYRYTKLRIIGANGQRLTTSGKVVVESIKINLYCLVFKRPIDIVNTDEEDLTELVQQAAYVSVITILNQ